MSRIDRVTGEPLRRYEHAHPGSMIHVDVTKFANIPDGGGHRYLHRAQGKANAHATARRTGERGAAYRPVIGTAYVHTVIDDHSRLAYAEICTDEKAVTAIGVLQRALTWYAERGVTVEKVLSDNGSAYKSHAWRDACTALGVRHKRTRPYRPQTNGKIERFHRTLGEGWAYARLYESTEQRNTALPGWLHFYNHHRAHSAIGGRPPVTRLTNLPEHHSPSRPLLEVIAPEIEAQLATVLATLSPTGWRAVDLVGQAIRPYVVRRPIGAKLLGGVIEEGITNVQDNLEERSQ